MFATLRRDTLAVMQRRSFLSLLVGAGAAAGGVALGVPLWLQPLLRVERDSVFPGCPIQVTASGSTPVGTALVFELLHGGHAQRSERIGVTPGEIMNARVPYPYAELRVGTHDVQILLVGAQGEVLERHAVGSYNLRLPMFSV